MFSFFLSLLLYRDVVVIFVSIDFECLVLDTLGQLQLLILRFPFLSFPFLSFFSFSSR